MEIFWENTLNSQHCTTTTTTTTAVLTHTRVVFLQTAWSTEVRWIPRCFGGRDILIGGKTAAVTINFTFTLVFTTKITTATISKT